MAIRRSLTPFALLLFPLGPARAQRPAEVTVIGLDYAFQAPATLPPGLTAFAFENRGKVPHEVVVIRLKIGVSLDSLVRAAEAERRELTEVVGILVAGPGVKPLGRLLVDLTAGRTYLLLCNFRDAADKPRHLDLGMLAPIQVK